MNATIPAMYVFYEITQKDSFDKHWDKLGVNLAHSFNKKRTAVKLNQRQKSKFQIRIVGKA
jgi:hypothetical protein